MDPLTIFFIVLFIVSFTCFAVVLREFIKTGREVDQIEILQTQILRMESIRKALVKTLLIDLRRRKSN